MIVEAPPELVSPDKLGRVHLIGIGGVGMSGIARILAARGIAVTGSDAHESAALAALRADGIDARAGHRAENVEDLDDADTVVVSSAIRADNPELVAARARGVRIWPRAAALAALMIGRRTVAVAGTHGKTTTTSMLTVGLQQCGLDPSYAIGGVLTATGRNAGDGAGDLFVAEADESDASFLLYSPVLEIVTSLEPDHLDHYGDEATYRQAFTDFVGRLTDDGVLVCCADDQGARELGDAAEAAGVRVRRYGSAEAAAGTGHVDVLITDRRADGVRQVLTVSVDGAEPIEVELRLPGRHNALNAAAALTAAVALGAEVEPFVRGLAGYAGTGRRFERKGEVDGVVVYDSYAHHPTELTADLVAARDVVGAGGRLVACFQPHLFSRTRIFADEFGAALGLADEVVVLDVYAAREDPEPGVDGRMLADRVPLDAEHVRVVPDPAAAAPVLAALVRPGDVVLTLGAGDVTGVGPALLELLSTAGGGGR